MNIPSEWLLSGPAWIEYRTRVDLLGEPESAAQVQKARQATLVDPQVQALLLELADWPGMALNSHKAAGHPLHKLVFVADLGLEASDASVREVIERILDHRSSEGPFQILMNIPTHFGGTGRDERVWALCDAPLVIYALVCFGLSSEPSVRIAIGYLAGLTRENGFPCAAAQALGKFRGPGRKEDPCPYATLVMLRMLAKLPEWRESPVCHIGAEAILSHWENSRERAPYLFRMGIDFRKLKAPLVWYDLLHVLDVLTQFPWLRKDVRLLEMVDILRGKMDSQGGFTPESIWTAWKGWDFGQKREPSRWVTLLAWRVLKRVDLVYNLSHLNLR